MEVREKEPMKLHTTFRAGGDAAWFVYPENTEELKEVLHSCNGAGVPFCLIGNGSNLLVSDRGFPGVMISTEKFDRLECAGNIIRAGAGVLLSKAAAAACKGSLTGFEALAGIPGTVGGAVVMNAGAYGTEIKDVLISATVLTEDGEIKVLTNEELNFGYRTSCISECGYLVLEAEFSLAFGEQSSVKAVMEDLAARRREKQPLEYGSAGSTFKRPAGYFAGKLIEDAGLKGAFVGGAEVSKKHAGFIINRGNATASDIYALCTHVKETVFARYGIGLELEVRLLGEF